MAAPGIKPAGGKSGLHRAAEWVTPTPREGRIRATETSLRHEVRRRVKRGNLYVKKGQTDEMPGS